MNRFKIPIILVITLLLFFGCSQNKYDNANHKTKILGHRAYGIKGYNDTLMDNTLPAIIKALDIADGVELDIQMSLDGTVWVYHDPQFYTEDSTLISIPQLMDDQITQHFEYLHPNTKINTLNEIFKYFGENQINKVISLDVKIIFNPNCFNKGYASAKYLNQIADIVIQLTKEYKISKQIMVETESEYLLDRFRYNSEINTYLLGFSNFEKLIKKAYKKDYTGVSQNYRDSCVSNKSMELAHKKGLSIQLWTPNSKNDLKSVLSLHPDFIQTDNINYFKDSL